MAGILRGSVHWAELDPVRGREQSGTRPVVVLSHELFNSKSQTVIAAAVTGSEPKAPFPISLELLDTGLAKRSWVKISQIRVLAVERLKSKIGTVKPDQMNKIVEGLNALIQ